VIRYVLLGACIAFAGCGASAVELHAQAAIATGDVLEVAHGAIRSRRSAEVTRAIEAAPTQETARSARDAIDVRYEPAIAAYEAARVVHQAWIRLIVLAWDGRPFDVATAMALAHDMVRAFHELRVVVERLGVELPDLGATVNAAMAAVQEGI